MAKQVITQFSGIAPMVPARYLPDNMAQMALNCPTWRGPLIALKEPVQVPDFTFSKVGDIESIYRFGQDRDSEVEYWFQWVGIDVDVVKGFIAGDTSERTFYTGDGVPKVTDTTLALTGGGTAYPIASYSLGVPLPTQPVAATTMGSPLTGEEGEELDVVTETRVYTYTWVNSWDEEGGPYSASPMPTISQCDVSTGQYVRLTFNEAPPTGNHNITAKRIYRSVVGTGITTYLFVAEIPAAQSTYDDQVAGDSLAEELPTLNFLPPPEDLTGLVGLPGGTLAGFVGNDIYFSEPYRPSAWPLQYQQTVMYKTVGLGVSDTTLVVLTQGKPYFIQGSHPDAMVVVEADVKQACVSKQSIVSINGVVFYASPDGLVAIAPSGSKVLTEAMFSKSQWQQWFKPSSIRAYIYENRYVAFYDNGYTQGGFIYDPASKTFTLIDVYATAGYSDLKNDTLYLVIDNKLHNFESDIAPSLKYRWRSKKFTYTQPRSYSCFRVNAENYPVDVTIYVNGAVHHQEEVTDDGVRRLPAGMGKDWEVELEGYNDVFSFKIGDSVTEISNGN